MRSIAEVVFRARQETANLLLLARPPRFSGGMPDRVGLPDPQAVVEALRGSEYAQSVETMAREVVRHRLPVFGSVIDIGKEIRWRRDYIHGTESALSYFRRIAYLDFATVGDHKYVWELNRHQHLVLLAQAFLLTGNNEFNGEILKQLDSWFEQNPFQRGINWASALEVAFRTLSWIWLYHLIGREMPESFRRQFLTELYRHGRHLAENLSIYFSPNTHLLGEAVALHALGRLFPGFPESREWERVGREIVEAQLDFQVMQDGSHFEQSTYYHVYALDFFLFFYVLSGQTEKLSPVLMRMGEYLQWLLGPGRAIACFGDDDGGRLFHPYGERDQFGRATLTTCGILFGREEWIGTSGDAAEQAAWWLGADRLKTSGSARSVSSGNRLFENCGSAFLQSGDLFIQVDCGPFGFGGAGHSHSDTLSLVASLGGRRVFRDPGTYTYTGDPGKRDWFRGSGAHNTIRVDGLDQGEPAGPFRWASKPEVRLNAWKPKPRGGFLDAVCEYRGFSHRRRVLLEPGRLLVFDEIDGPSGEHVCEQVWQFGPGASDVRLSFSHPATEAESEWSPVYGTKCSGKAAVVSVRGAFPIAIAMLLETEEMRSGISAQEARQVFEKASR
jgi:hypothetical protein